MNSQYGADSFELYKSPYADQSNATIIEFKNSPFFFIIEPFPDNYEAFAVNFTQYSPNFGKINPSPRATLTLNQVITYIGIWLQEVVRPYLEDQKTIDIWKEFKNGREHLNIETLDINDLSHFTKDDQLRIKWAIQDFKELIQKNLQITQEQMVMVGERLNYLIEVSERAPKTDWKGIAISVIASIVIALSLDTSKGNQLWELFLHVFRSITLLPTGE